MKSAQTVVVERDDWFGEALSTEPFEAGWAEEAIWFVNVLDSDGASWVAVPEISPDGLNWLPLAETEPIHFASPGMYALSLSHFGVWLRLSLSPSAGTGRCKMRLTLTLK